SPSPSRSLSTCSSTGDLRQLGGPPAGPQDVLVGAAAAEIAADRPRDLRVARRRAPVEQRAQAHDLAGRAEPALEGVHLDEGALDRVELVAARDPLDGPDLAAVAVDRQQQARVDGPAVDQDGAGPAV